MRPQVATIHLHTPPGSRKPYPFDRPHAGKTLGSLVLHGSLSLLLLYACAAPPQPTPSPPEPAQRLISQAQTARAAGDREAEALALREALETLAKQSPPPPNLSQTRADCVSAMVEAGGNAESYRLWTSLGRKNPESAAESKRMAERARKLMLQQGQELLAQADIDLAAGHPESAVCSAKAALQLLQQAGGSEAQIQLAKAAVERAQKPEKHPAL